LLWTLLKNVLTELGTHCSPQDFATHAKLVEHGSYASFCWYWVVVGLSLLRFTFSNCSQKVDQILDRLNTHAFWNSASKQKSQKSTYLSGTICTIPVRRFATILLAMVVCCLARAMHFYYKITSFRQNHHEPCSETSIARGKKNRD
jgi:hypothetical protein